MSATPDNENAPVTYSLRVLPRAERDRDEAVVQMAEQAGDEAAIEWRVSFAHALASLATNPRRYAVPNDAGGFTGEVRAFIFRRAPGTAPYRLIYRVAEDANDGPRVTLLHIRHAAARPMTKKEAREIEAQNRE